MIFFQKSKMFALHYYYMHHFWIFQGWEGFVTLPTINNNQMHLCVCVFSLYLRNIPPASLKCVCVCDWVSVCVSEWVITQMLWGCGVKWDLQFTSMFSIWCSWKQTCPLSLSLSLSHSLSLSLSLLYKPIETHLVLLKYPLNISCVGAGFDLTIFNQFSFHN